MKISDIAKKLGMTIKEVRDKAKDLDFTIAQKSNTMSDKRAKEFIEVVQKGFTLAEESKPDQQEIAESIEAEEAKDERIVVEVPDVVSVKEFSDKLELPVTKVMTELIKNGVMASLNENIGKFFSKIGIVVLEGYGLTETSPVISANRENDIKFGTVGKVIPGVKIKISEKK
mgnify:CR=1 FL=1